jgi:hypothetical protein
LHLENQTAHRRVSGFNGEFDPGSGRTLAACLIHASRAGLFAGSLRAEGLEPSGGRVSNAWVTCPEVRDNSSKGLLIPYVVKESSLSLTKGENRFRVGPRPIS